MKVRVVIVSSVLAAALAAGVLAQADVFTQLGSNETEAREQIFSAFSSGSPDITGTREVFKSATAEGRVVIVKAVSGFARAYSTSADFAKRYAAHRDNQKPSVPSAMQSGDQMRAAQRKGMEEAIASAQKTAAAMPSMKKNMDELIADLKKQLAEIGADKGANAAMDDMMKNAAAMQADEHKRALVDWEKEYPADSKRMIALRLKQFLDESATVDFAATTALSKEDKRLKFTNAAYEEKSANWKLIYRAGKPAVDAARGLAQEWLKAISG